MVHSKPVILSHVQQYLISIYYLNNYQNNCVRCYSRRVQKGFHLTHVFRVANGMSIVRGKWASVKILVKSWRNNTIFFWYFFRIELKIFIYKDNAVARENQEVVSMFQQTLCRGLCIFLCLSPFWFPFSFWGYVRTISQGVFLFVLVCYLR